MITFWIDSETFSECDLKAHGTHRYAEHPSTEITVFQYAYDDGEPVVIDCTQPGGVERAKAVVRAAAERQDVIFVAHASHFDRTLLRHCWGIDIPVERWQDTMIKAMAHGLPGGLDKIGQIVGLEDDQAKDKRGRELIQLFCKPRPKGHALRRATRETHPKEWQEFLEYSRQDIVAMRAIDRALPSWNYRTGHPELALWHLDQHINDRGVMVDTDLALAATEAVAREQKRLKAAVVEATDGHVTNASQRDNLLTFILAEYGVNLPDMKADTLRRRLEDPDLPDGVKLLLSLRLEATKTSTAKYRSLLNAASTDGRLRNTLQFCGAARTGRWAGRLVQLQNLPRPDMEQGDIDTGIDALKAGCADLLFPNVMQLTANTVRSCLVAGPGRKMVVADLSNIEGRALAWLAGERWKLKAFSEFDQGNGHDLYKLAYARSFGTDPSSVTKAQRQIGKVQELACLAGDTPVVTDRGIKRLDSVTTGDKVWDGQQWVQHQGLVARGVKATVNLAGIEVTPDHLIRTGPTWKQAQQLVSSASTFHLALATGMASWSCLESSAAAPASSTSTWCASDALAALNPTSSTITTSAKARALAAGLALGRPPGSGARSTTGTRTLFRTTITADACSTGSRHASTGATTRTTAGIATTGAAASRSTNRGAPTAVRFSSTLSRWMGGTTQSSNWTVRTLTAGTPRATCGSSRNARTRATGAKSSTCSNASQNLRPVYDLLNAGPLHRFTVMTSRGPLLVHNCGYEGGPAAYLTMAAVYGMDLNSLADTVRETAPADELVEAKGRHDWMKKMGRTRGLSEHVFVSCQALVSMWRKAHPMTTALWKAADESVRAAIANPGVVFSIGSHLKARVDGKWLRVRLPSGRYLCYINPRVDDDNRITFFGVNQYTRQWSRIVTYSGKLAENFTQGVARDVLAYPMPDIEAAGYDLLTSVHDELLTETPDTDEFNADELGRLMATPPAWAAGIPLAAAGFETYRYRKD
jgi:hypothetical protein